MYLASDLRKGLKFEIDGEPYVIVDFEFKKPGKGQSLYKCKLKNMITGSQFERTYRSGDKFPKADLEEQEMEYLYKDQDSYCFMNSSNYEQIFMNEDQLGDVTDLLKENTVCTVLLYNGNPIGVTLPNFIHLEITKAELGNAAQEVGLKTCRVGIDGHIELFNGLGIVFLLQVHLAIKKEMVVVDLCRCLESPEGKQEYG